MILLLKVYKVKRVDMSTSLTSTRSKPDPFIKRVRPVDLFILPKPIYAQLKPIYLCRSRIVFRVLSKIVTLNVH